MSDEKAVATAQAAAADPNWPRDLDARLKRVGKATMEVIVELGRTRVPLAQLADTKEGSVIELEKLSGQPMEVLVNGVLFARGEIVVVGDNLAIRVTEMVAPEDR